MPWDNNEPPSALTASRESACPSVPEDLAAGFAFLVLVLGFGEGDLIYGCSGQRILRG
jgi:hypothetical protein